MKFSLNIREEELKNIIAREYFNNYLYEIIGNIDFCISKKVKENINQGDLFNEDERQSFLWAEAKKGNKADIIESFIQLILTIGKARTFEKLLPPIYLGAFDCEKISFIEYSKIQEIFIQNDFNWKITPSNHDSKEFKQLKNMIEKQLNKNKLTFNFEEDDKELKEFIKYNFKFGDRRKQNTIKIQITKNNFTTIYLKWLKNVKSTININWEKVKNNGILDADFYLADLLSKDNESIKDNLFVILTKDKYEFNKKIDDLGLFSNNTATFSDNQKAHNNFWMWYERPPKKEFWNYIIERRDLLVPQDVRERKGSYFTPQQWVELSQKYLVDALGEDWQEEYYIWDCCAGTGNLLNGLTNKYNIWASTLDKADIDVMKDRIKNGANLLESHIFQMDFLNDNFGDKCPKDLLDIINNPEKRKKLVIYINPPYVEAGSSGKISKKAAIGNMIYNKYKEILGVTKREIYILFFIRIYKEIPDCILAEFSKLKILNAPNFKKFREIFLAKLKSLFLVPANTFDNVKGQFPIGFHIWDLKEKEIFKEILCDVYYKDNENFLNKRDLTKKIISYDDKKFINNWIDMFRYSDSISIATMIGIASDFQQQKYTIIREPYMKVPASNHNWQITNDNLIQSCIYLSVRQCIEAIWLNDRDQFLYPKDGWQEDKEFQSDCLVYTLFHGQNQIKSKDGINNWIPFTEMEVEPKNNFESHFMTDYIKENNIVFSSKALAVMEVGKELYNYYHSKDDSNPNASFYDIREYFQGRDKNGRMNNKSLDEKYTELLGNLKEKHKMLGDKIAEKVYEYEFLI